ncbi:MAG: ATP-dependent DNA helicase RecQ [Deltaproteobacteria bacterium]|nr:ATP-dependent DNA helicase RecQ [Deltaproteobacteria bacterium]
MDRIGETLQKDWGFSDFRPGQRAVVESIAAGRQVLAVMPTGAGKSLCYQLPALLLDGVTLVVSPLVALMKDQVDSLTARGVPAACVNSSMDFEAQRQALRAAQAGALKLLYVAPERFRFEGAMAQLKRVPIGFMAVDEAHCISHWGHDFRPDYQNIGEAHRAFGSPRIAAFTATATAHVRQDIVRSLGLVDPVVTVAGFRRPNLHLSVVEIKQMKDKRAWATKVLKSALGDGGAGIVYCATRKHCEAVADALGRDGLKVVLYHGGLDDAARVQAQERFQATDGVVMVATNAFGMGVDKADVRAVVHWDFPGSVDAYYQEAGRAGRDGKRAFCVMLFTYADQRIHEFFIANGGENLPTPQRVARAEAEQQKLKAMTRWAYHEGCRHQALLRYFGEAGAPCDLSDPDGSRCDNCAGDLGLTLRGTSRPATPTRGKGAAPAASEADDAEQRARALTPDEQVVVQKALSAVARSQGRLDKKALAKILWGSKTADVLADPLAATKSYGILKGMPDATVRRLLAELQRAGCTTGKAPTLTDRGRDVMWGKRAVELGMAPFGGGTAKTATSTAAPKVGAAADDAGLGPAETERLRTLKARRQEVAKERGVPAFVVASNALLERLAALRPGASTHEWLEVKGVGDKNVDLLREAFSDLV